MSLPIVSKALAERPTTWCARLPWTCFSFAREDPKVAPIRAIQRHAVASNASRLAQGTLPAGRQDCAGRLASNVPIDRSQLRQVFRLKPLTAVKGLCR